MAATYSFTDDYAATLPAAAREERIDELRRYLFTDAVELTDAEPLSPGRYRGTATVLRVPCAVETLILPGAALAILCARPLAGDQPWTFGRSFPQLPGEEVTAGQENGRFRLRGLTLDNPLWVYAGLNGPADAGRIGEALGQMDLWKNWNRPGKDALPQLPVVSGGSGLHLWGGFPEAPPVLEEVLAFLSVAGAEDFIKKTVVRGRVEYRPPATYTGDGAPLFPTIQLELPLGRTAIGSEAVQFEGVVALAAPLRFSRDGAGVALRGELRLAELGAGSRIAAEIDFPIGADILSARGRYVGQGLPFIDAGTLPGPGETPALDIELALQFSKSEKKLKNLAFTAALGRRSLFDGRLTLEELRLFFRIFDPLGQRLATATMDARALLGTSRSLTVAFGGSYPDGRLYLSLEQASLRTLAGELGITDDTAAIPDLTVSRMAAEFNYNTRFFSAELLVDSQWSLLWLRLGELRFGIRGGAGALELSAAAGFTLAGAPLQASLHYASHPGQGGAWQFAAGLAPGETVALDTLLTELAAPFGDIHLPPVLAGLTVHTLVVSFDTLTQHFRFDMGLAFPVDGKTLELNLLLDIEKQGERYVKRFGGAALIAGMTFALDVSKSATEAALAARFDAPQGLDINPLNLLTEIAPSLDFAFDDEDAGLSTLTIYQLGFRFASATQNQTTTRTYQFTGAARWITNIPFSDDTRLAVAAELDISIRKAGTGPRQLSGLIRGALQTDIAFFENFRLIGEYRFSQTQKELNLIIGIRDKDVVLGIEKTTAGTILSASVRGLTFGDILSFLVGLVLPDEEDYQLDPPWDALNRVSLDDFRLEINTTKKSFTVAYQRQISLGFMTIDEFSLSYVPPAGNRPRGVMIRLEKGTFLGKALDKPLAWDAVNDAPPAVPGKGATLFDLRYLGIGQRVSLNPADVAQLENITQVMTLLRGGMAPLSPQQRHRNPMAVAREEGREVIQFNADSSWLFGISFFLLNTLDLQVIFNDPLIYGLRVEVQGEAIPDLKGLKFEILYRRISDTIGVYHTDLTLPDSLRHLKFGAVEITIPVIVLDIYTNGDFKIDLGFPWNGDFSRSFGVVVKIFTGSAGLYFNKLSAATATSTPPVSQDVGVFDPVIEFGLGLSIGIGREFRKGPLRASLSLTLEGIIEGLFAWFNPAGGGEKVAYYRVKGVVAIVGRIYGEVDFKVVSADVSIVARAAVLFAVEVYEPVYIALVAEVSVKASAKILGIRVSFSFSTRVSQEFTLGERQPKPWDAPGRSIAAARAAGRARSVAAPLRWAPVRVGAGDREPVELYFQPAFTRDHADVRGVALFFIENSIAPGNEDPGAFAADAAGRHTAFDALMEALLNWALSAYFGALPAGDAVLTPEQLRQLLDRFVRDEEAPDARFDLGNLTAFLRMNFVFHLTDRPGPLRSGAYFPVFPQLTMETPAGAVDFSDERFAVTPADRRRLADYYRELRAGRGDAAAVAADEDTLSGAAFLFLDYFALLVRSGLQAAIDYLEDQGQDSITRAALLSALDREGPYNHIAGMASRYLLHGLRLPRENAAPAPVFEASGQQFTIANPEQVTSAFTLTFRRGSDDLKDWIKFRDYPASGPPVEDAARLSYALPADAVQLVRALPGMTPAFLLPAPPVVRRLAHYQPAPQRFLLREGKPWTPFGNAATGGHSLPEAPLSVQEFSSGLSDLLAAHPGGLSLLPRFIRPDGRQAEGPAGATAFLPAARLEFRVKRIPGSGGAGPLAGTYQLAGAGEAEQARLRAILAFLAANAACRPELFLWHPAEEETTPGYISRSDATCFLLKTNLSTQRRLPAAAGRDLAKAPLPGAYLSEGADFLRLLWEGCTVEEGGFFLHYRYEESGELRNLPEALFAGGEEAALPLFIVLTENGNAMPLSSHLLRPFHTCLLPLTPLPDPAEKILVLETKQPVPVLNIPAGHLGIRLERPNPASVPGSTELDAVYQLLALSVPAQGPFRAGNDSLPVGPVAGDPGDERWVYEKVLPVYRLADSALSGGDATTPPPDEDPYAGAGADIRIDLFWQDLFGNRLSPAPAQHATFPVRYVDPLLGINQWPSVVEEFFFEKASAGAVRLTITLHLDPSRFFPSADRPEPTEDLRERIRGAREQFRKAYYQLHQPDLRAVVRQSLMPGEDARESAAALGALRDFVGRSYRYLDELDALPDDELLTGESLPGAIPPAATITELYTPAGADGERRYPAELIFPVSVRLELRRDVALVDPAIAAATPAVAAITAHLSPRTTPAAGGAPEDSFASLRPFAEAFEAAFPGLRLAVGEGQSRALAAAAAGGDQFVRPLWAVHFDLAAGEGGPRGVYYDIRESAPVFYALAPLANTPLSGEAPGAVYSPAAGLTPGGAARRVEGVDLNVLARDFLVACEALLDAATIVPAREAAPGPVDQIIAAKADLAAAIAGRLAPVLDASGDTEAGRAAAREALRQRLLINLVQGYDQETVVQYPVDVRLPAAAAWPGQAAPRLAGRPVVTSRQFSGDAEPDFTLSTAAIELSEENAFLTFFFDTRSPERFEDVELTLDFRVAAMEYGITAMPGIPGYQTSSWLSFVLPFGDEPANHLGRTAIPIPLRHLPLPPALVRQQAGADPDSRRSLTSIREWQYLFTYEHPDVAQDTIEATVEYNVPDPGATARRAARSTGAPDLFEALIRFHDVYPQLLSDLERLRQGANDDATRTALHTFRQLTADVAAAWPRWPAPESAAGEAGHYQIDEVKSGARKAVSIAVAPASPRQSFPLMLLPGYRQDSTPAPLAFLADGSELRLVAWDGNLYRCAPAGDGAAATVADGTEALESAVALSAGGRRLARGYDGGGIDLWPDVAALATSAPLRLDLPGPVAALAFSPDDRYLAAAGGTGLIRVWDVAAPAKAPWEYAFENLAVSALAVANGGKSLAAGGDAGRLFLWRDKAAPPLELASLDGASYHYERVSALAFSADGVRLASAAWDGKVLVWATAQPAAPPAELGDFGSRVSVLAFRPDGAALAGGSWDGQVRHWTLDGAAAAGIHRLQRLDAPVAGLAYHPRSGALFASTWDRRVVAWPRPEQQPAPGFTLTQHIDGKRTIRYCFTEKPAAEAALDPVFGESDIPDRTLIFPDLDVLRQQNAWGAIWLTRNKELVKDRRTNPAFVFRTPAVRFTNRSVPYLINDERWRIDQMHAPGTGGLRPLADHLGSLFRLLLVFQETPAYDMALSCRYAFSLAGGSGLSPDLVSALPVLVALPVPNPATEAGLDGYIQELAQKLLTWHTQTRPATEEAFFRFQVSLFSRIDPGGRTSLPLLRIDRLELPLAAISELAPDRRL